MPITKGLSALAKIYKGTDEVKKVYVNNLLVYSAAPIYAIALDPTTINENATTTAVITTTNVDDGTTLYWTIEGVSGTINASDFSTSFSGSVNINSDTGTFNITTAADSLTEGTESFLVRLRTDSTSGTIVATSNTVTINDTSQTPPPFFPPYFPPFFPPSFGPAFTPPPDPPAFTPPPDPPAFTPPPDPPAFTPPPVGTKTWVFQGNGGVGTISDLRTVISCSGVLTSDTKTWLDSNYPASGYSVGTTAAIEIYDGSFPPNLCIIHRFAVQLV